jgi:hypothetical protein
MVERKHQLSDNELFDLRVEIGTNVRKQHRRDFDGLTFDEQLDKLKKVRRQMAAESWIMENAVIRGITVNELLRMFL